MILALLLVVTGCRGEETVVLEPSPAPQLERFGPILRGLRMNLVGSDGVLGAKVSLLELRSATNPTVVAFWATYCPPCIEEMKILDELHAEGHRIVGVSMDSSGHAEVAEILRRLSPRYPQGILERASVEKVGLALEHGLPASLVLDRRGHPRVMLGASTKARFLEAIEEARASP